jgi:asparagine synthase (glutamine-hydrolysing)
MCGIVGLYRLDGRVPCDRALLLRMRDMLRHRGPDDAGDYVAGPLGLGHRRLSIIDLASGRQPLGNEDGSIQIVFNGEIYNFRELQRDAERLGHRFATRTDTEAIVHLYEELGERVVDRLDGMFAFALWDTKRRRLLLARDRAGIKPLYYAQRDGWFAFASEIRPLLLLPWVSREIDPQSVDDYLARGYVEAPRTMFRHVSKLPAAHTLTVTDKGVEVSRYWLARPRTTVATTPHELEAQLVSELDRSVRMHLVSDVPLGAFLSGGLDSSIVVALMRRHCTGRLKTFSVGIEADGGLPHPDLDESAHARRVAEYFATDHHEISLSQRDAPDLLSAVAGFLDEPVSDPAALPTYQLAKLARESVTVVLTGEGADETWGGYDVFRKAWVVANYRRLPVWLRRTLTDPILTHLPRSGAGARMVAASRTASYVGQLSQFEASVRRALYTADGNAAVAMPPEDDDVGDPALDPSDPFASVARDLIDSHLAERLLVKVDRMTMAHSLEARVPFLAPQLVEFAFAVPARLKLRGATRKYLLRRAFRDQLPPTIAQRQKHNFDLPCAAWLRSSLAPVVDALVAQRILPELLDQQRVATLWRRHREGSADCGTQIWSLMTLGLWERSIANG